MPVQVLTLLSDLGSKIQGIVPRSILCDRSQTITNIANWAAPVHRSESNLCNDGISFPEANRCEKKMTSDLSNSLLCHEEEQLRELVEEWHSYVSQANAFDEDLVLVTHRTIVEPLKKFQGVFSETRSALKKRDHAMKKCVEASEKVQKLQGKEKTGPNIVKLEAEKINLSNLEEDFKAQDRLLKAELPLLYEGRIEYFQPCLEALIKAQVEHSGNCASLIPEAIPSLNTFNSSEVTMKQQQNNRFSQIHALSIVGDN